MKYFILSMYILWIGLTIILSIKEIFDKKNANIDQ